MVAAVGEAAWRTLSAGARTLDEAQLRALSPMAILTPHPDDETLGCGGLLATAALLGLHPRVAFLTDGAASHTGSPTWPKTRLASVRRAEAIAALAELGVGEDQALFLDWPDSAPYPKTDRRFGASVAALLTWFETFSPKSLWAPWPGEAHCDHAAAADLAAAARRAWRQPLRLMDFVVWGWRSERLVDGPGGGVVWALPCRDHIERRRRALSRHQTQTSGLIDDAAQSFLIPPDLAALTERPTEVFLERL
jgi:LmbE family N-acetylglucosaminyl deacetylase